jgi:hypothetical protein
MSEAWKIAPGIPTEPTEDNRRRAGRLACSMLTSSFGDVVDLSVTGMRCRAARPPEANVGLLVDFHLKTLAGVIPMQGRVVWTTKKAWRRYETGVQFVNVSDELRRTLIEVARISTNRECIKRSA